MVGVGHRDGSPHTVVILKRLGGSVWRETARTLVCPTAAWLAASYGTGEYELRLLQGNRVLCMVSVHTVSEP